MNDEIGSNETGAGLTGEGMPGTQQLVPEGLPSVDIPGGQWHSNEGTSFEDEGLSPLSLYTSPVGENEGITPQVEGEVTGGTEKVKTPLTEETAQLLVRELQQFNSSVEMLHRIMTDTKFPNSVEMLGRMLSDSKINNLIRVLEGNLGSRY